MTKLSVNEALLKAKSHVKRGEVTEAKQLYQAVLQAFPNNKDAKQGLTALNTKAALHLGSQPPQKTINELLSLYRQGDLDILVQRAQALTAQYPKTIVLWSMLGAAHKGLGRVDLAAEAFKKVTELNPSLPNGFNNLGIVLQEQGKLDEAIAHYKRALSLKPDLAEAHYNVGNALRDLGRLDDATAAFQQALSLKPNYSKALRNLGLAWIDKGMFDEAIAALQKLVSLEPDHAEARYNLGLAYQGQGALDEAVAAYQKAVSLDPAHAESYNNLGLAFHDLGQLGESIASYRKALSLNPQNAEAAFNMGNALRDQGKLDEATALYKDALLWKPDDVEMLINAASAFKYLGKLDEALAFYKAALSLRPDFAPSACNLVKFPIGTIDEATIADLSDRSETILANTEDPSHRAFFEGNLLSHQGRFDEAFEVFVHANNLEAEDKSLLVAEEQMSFEHALERLSRWSPRPQSDDPARVKQLLIFGPSRSGKSTLESLLTACAHVCPVFESINLAALVKREAAADAKEDLKTADLFHHDEESLVQRGYKVITSTLPNAILHVDRLMDGLPGAFCVFVKRDPIDIASEIFTQHYKKANFYSYDPKTIAKYLDTYHAAWEELKRKAPERTLELAFEDVLTKPKEAVETLGRRMGLDFEPGDPPNPSTKPRPSRFREHYAARFLGAGSH